MSDYLPFELQDRIMKLLPVKSLIRFRSVSKTWKSWIDSSGFVHTYTHTRKQTPHVLVSSYAPCLFGYNKPPYKQTFISVPDDDSFPFNRVSLDSIRHCFPLDNLLQVIGCSHGLLCYFSYEILNYSLLGTAVIWNPCIRRALQINIVSTPIGPTRQTVYNTVLGFGVCRVTNDPKIVKLSYNTKSDYVIFEVDLFTLSTMAWRSLSESDKLPRKSVRFEFLTRTRYSVAIDGFFYWLATDEITARWLIVFFDMTSENFGEVNLPDRLAPKALYNFRMSKLGESLVLIECADELDTSMYSVWTMEGHSGLFTQLYTFNVNVPNGITVLGFRLRGDAIIEITENGITELAVYERLSKRINKLGFSGRSWEMFFAHSYMETLFLHDRPDLTFNTEALQDK